jgi:hypothetical protein
MAKSALQRAIRPHKSGGVIASKQKRATQKMKKARTAKESARAPQKGGLNLDYPGHSLKAIRERARVSQRECAVAVGMDSPGSGFARYENAEPYLTKRAPIPANIIAAIAPLLVGRGNPPVQMAELVAISDAQNIMKLAVGVAKGSSSASARSGGVLSGPAITAEATKESIIRGLEIACEYCEQVANSPLYTDRERAGANIVLGLCRARIEEIQNS